MKIIVMTSDKHLWLTRPFAHLWNKYVTPDLKVTVCGFTPPNFDYPPNFDFFSIGNFPDYPANHWSNAFLKVMDKFQDEKHLALFLEDYWMVRRADYNVLKVAEMVMETVPNALRFDITSDRLYSGDVSELACVGHFDIIQSHDTPYQMSLQAGVFNIELLRQIIKPDKSPWDIEMEGTNYLSQHKELLVLGTRQWPFRYQIAVVGGQFNPFKDTCVPPRHLSRKDYDEMVGLGFIPKIEGI
jgi:hypothetical protein